ncbi:MAG: sensor histidine kinase [bacterium]
MLETDSTQFIVAVGFAVSAILLIVVSYAIHILVSNRHLRQAQEKLRALTVRLSSAEEQERKRIAEELHDRIGETLIVCTRSIEQLKKKWGSGEARQDFDQLTQTLRQLMKGTRSLIFDLIPPALYDLGLEAAVESFVVLCQRQYQIDIKIEDDGRNKPVEQDVAVFLYKAIRELILNVAKHARADTATIKLSRRRNHYRVVVEDNGVGFSSKHSNNHHTYRHGYGLFNIQIQAEHYRGHLEIDRSRPKGGAVMIAVPLRTEETDAA